MLTERLESMSPNGFLRLIREDDGDIIVTVGQSHSDDDPTLRIATIQFCTPFIGGGGSSRTWASLVQLMGAMAEDNMDDRQRGRRPEFVDNADQHALIQWAKQCRVVEDESNRAPLKPNIEQAAMQVVRNRIENGTIADNPDVEALALAMMPADELDEWIRDKG